MLTLNSGSVSLSRSAWGDSVQTIWLVGRHSDPFTLDDTVLCCLTVAPLGMFLLAYLLDTYPLVFESHGCMISVSSHLFCNWLEILLGVSSRENLQHFLLLSASVWEMLCWYWTALYLLRQSLVSVSKVRMYAWKILLHERIPVLQFCFKSNAGYLLMPCYSLTLCSFVRLPDEFYVTICNVAVVSDSSRKYAVGYSLLCSCCWQLDICVK